MIKSRYDDVRKTLMIIMLLNFAVALTKIVLGLLTKSASIFADGAHSVTDGTSNVIGIIGISLAAAPKDDEHPYGHKKIETMTALFIVVMLVYIGIKIIWDAVLKFSNPITPDANLLSIIMMGITFIINYCVAKYEYNKGKALNSMILISDSTHTKSDLYITLGVIISLCAIRLGAHPIIDPFVSIIVALFILKAAYEIFRDASRVLIDRAVVDRKSIEDIALQHNDVLDVHNIRSRGTNDEIHIDMHILADPSLTIATAHEMGHNIERAICEELKCKAEVIVHIEPYMDGHVDREYAEDKD